MVSFCLGYFSSDSASVYRSSIGAIATVAKSSNDRVLGVAKFCFDVSNLHPSVGRLVIGVQSYLVDRSAVLGLVTLGTFVTFARRGDRFTICLSMSQARLGQGRELLLFGFPHRYGANRCVFLHS